MKVLFVASECVPFIKTGGLADVVGSLPIELNKQGVDARVILPKYNQISEEYRYNMKHVCDFDILFGQEHKFCGVDMYEANGVKFYFIDNEETFFGDSLYGGGLLEGFRFAFFCRAVLEALQRLDFVPDLLHLNDWQTGLIAPLLRTQYMWDEKLQNVKILYTIHNLKYQGLFDFKKINEKLGLDETLYNKEGLEFYDCLSFMKAGIVYSDYVSTVSMQYAQEIQTPYYGERLDGLLRKKSAAVTGILNGINTSFYNPEEDAYLKEKYSSKDTRGKEACKEALQQEAGLSVRKTVPIIGMITRLTPQKGLDLIECVLSDMMRMDIQLMFLGSGDRHYMDLINWASWRYPGQVASYFGMNEPLAHRVYAGSDMFLMPSQFEPCGLSQMISMRYGTVPIVRETGGLKESVLPYNKYTDEGNGFSFANYNAHEMLFTVESAVHYYYEEKEMWARMVKRCMETDFGWNVSAGKYKELYETVLGIKKTAKKKEPVKAKAVPSKRNSKTAKTAVKS